MLKKKIPKSKLWVRLVLFVFRSIICTGATYIPENTARLWIEVSACLFSRTRDINFFIYFFFLSKHQLTHCWLGMATDVSTSAMAPNIWSVRPWFFCRAFILLRATLWLPPCLCCPLLLPALHAPVQQETLSHFALPSTFVHLARVKKDPGRKEEILEGLDVMVTDRIGLVPTANTDGCLCGHSPPSFSYLSSCFLMLLSEVTPLLPRSLSVEPGAVLSGLHPPWNPTFFLFIGREGSHLPST